MNTNTNQKKIVKYYTNPETKLGFDYLLWGSKHFGFYPTGKVNISEKEAQTLYQDLVAKNLDLKENQIVLIGISQMSFVRVILLKIKHRY